MTVVVSVHELLRVEASGDDWLTSKQRRLASLTEDFAPDLPDGGRRRGKLLWPDLLSLTDRPRTVLELVAALSDAGVDANSQAVRHALRGLERAGLVAREGLRDIRWCRTSCATSPRRAR